jgi:serine/threonine protein kinase
MATDSRTRSLYPDGDSAGKTPPDLQTEAGTEGIAITDHGILTTEKAPSLPAEQACREWLRPHPGERLADFELLELLGEGSFGQVFLARQLTLDREVAVKVTRNQGSEARTLASLEHDHIVQVFTEDVEPARGLRLLCMQYVPGTTLAQVLRRLRKRPLAARSGALVLEAIDELTRHPAPFHPAALRDRDLLARADLTEAVCWLGARLAEALDHAHSRKVLHRDIKPANILLNHYGRPFLADFNLSLSTRLAAADGGALFGGTIAYMAPEHLEAFAALEGRAERDAVDERSDLYALGLVLFEMATGQRGLADEPVTPLPGAGPKRETDWRATIERLAAVRRQDCLSARQLNPEVSEALDRVLSRCLDPDPARRYQTAKDLAGALDGCRELRRIERALPAPGPLTRAGSRHPLLLLLVLTFVPQVVGSLLNISYNALRIVGDLTAAQQTTFTRLVLGYNVIVYPLCFLLLYHVVAPVWRTWSRLTRCEPIGAEEAAAARRRALSWPRWVVGLSGLGWLPGGILFPTVVHLASAPVSGAVFGHFLISFLLSGLIALTYSFFGVQFVVLRILYPRLWVECANLPETIRRELGPLENRLRLFQLLAGAIPLIGAVLMVAVGPEISGYRTFRLLVTGLITLGMAGFGLAILVNVLLLRIVTVFTSSPGPQIPSGNA